MVDLDAAEPVFVGTHAAAGVTRVGKVIFRYWNTFVSHVLLGDCPS